MPGVPSALEERAAAVPFHHLRVRFGQVDRLIEVVAIYNARVSAVYGSSSRSQLRLPPSALTE